MSGEQTFAQTGFKVASDESHLNVRVGSDGQSHKTVSTNHNLWRAEDGTRTDVQLSALDLKPVLNWANVREKKNE